MIAMKSFFVSFFPLFTTKKEFLVCATCIRKKTKKMARQPEKPPRKSYLLARQSGQRIVLFKRRMRADDMQQILRCSRICDRL